ncbi:hypothetical protein DL770_011299 [Monosporascus sp. CRB-9-2]|nr:hypothetical protein DL770_011299 [Monosporascus sp. CRB-9-2]
MASSHPASNRCENSDDGRSNCRRETTRSTARVTSTAISDTAMPLGSASTPVSSDSTSAAHHAASSRCSSPRATNSMMNPATLPIMCEASTTNSGTCMRRRSSASSLAGVTPETSSITPATIVSAASSPGDSLTAARPNGAPAPERNSNAPSMAAATTSGSRK